MHNAGITVLMYLHSLSSVWQYNIVYPVFTHVPSAQYDYRVYYTVLITWL